MYHTALTSPARKDFNRHGEKYAKDPRDVVSRVFILLLRGVLLSEFLSNHGLRGIL